MRKLLEMENVTAGYGATVVLEQVTLAVAEKSATALLGRNGAGKTTLLSTIMGHTRQDTGTVRFKGTDLMSVPTHHRCRHGIALVPQEREIFPSLTVNENLKVAARPGGDWNVARVYELFPRLHERKKNFGNQLSGGEQQMLAVGRALVSNPSLLLLDEPFEGLAPVIVDMLVDALGRIRSESAVAILLVEHNVDLALELTDDVAVLDRGRVVWEGSSAYLRSDRERLSGLIGLQEVSNK